MPVLDRSNAIKELSVELRPTGYQTLQRRPNRVLMVIVMLRFGR